MVFLGLADRGLKAALKPRLPAGAATGRRSVLSQAGVWEEDSKLARVRRSEPGSAQLLLGVAVSSRRGRTYAHRSNHHPDRLWAIRGAIYRAGGCGSAVQYGTAADECARVDSEDCAWRYANSARVSGMGERASGAGAGDNLVHSALRPKLDVPLAADGLLCDRCLDPLVPCR